MSTSAEVRTHRAKRGAAFGLAFFIAAYGLTEEPRPK